MILGLTGLPGAGKDTVADYLVRRHGFTKMAFADPLYDEVAEAFGVTVDFLRNRATKETPLPELALRNCREPGFVDAMAVALLDAGEDADAVALAARSPRWVLRMWGTEYRRAQRPDYWVDRTEERLYGLLGTKIVLTDVRFENEADLVLGYRPSQITNLWCILRTGTQGSSHASDRGIPSRAVDVFLNNFENHEVLLFREVDRHLERLLVEWSAKNPPGDIDNPETRHYSEPHSTNS